VGALDYARQHRVRFVDELKTLLRIPSISTLPEHRNDVRQAAEWLLAHLRELGMTAELIPLDGGHPMVYAQWMQAPNRPTVLFYGHYDVQPVDPLAEWTSPPFEPNHRGDDLFARGARDDKGQIFAILKALESFTKDAGRLPLNVKVLIEGEEEIGSPGISRWMDRHARKLACDMAWVSDGAMYARDLPSIVTGLRGLLYTEVEVRGAAHDLHSGTYGGAVPNPVNAVATIIAGLKDRRGRVTVPRFYAAVRDPSPEEKASWERLPFREEDFMREAGITAALGEEGYGILERRWSRPTLDAHGIAGGWTGAGSKTVIPARVVAKISMRLVPDQRTKTVFRAFEKKVKQLAPSGIEVEVRDLSSGDPVLVVPTVPPIQAAARVARVVWGADPVYVREGGSIPPVAKFDRLLKVPTVLFGFGLPDDNTHGPNEKLHLPNFHRGIETVIQWMEQVAG
jgi:acetylornithine deacetylase/succinyl-diaminopimelate desuccinylase-like protein